MDVMDHLFLAEDVHGEVGPLEASAREGAYGRGPCKTCVHSMEALERLQVQTQAIHLEPEARRWVNCSGESGSGMAWPCQAPSSGT